jgi:sulfite exporter TauE/SafE
MYLLQAFLIGILGSFHCIGMCGPIALALPLKNQSLLSKIFSSLIYNGGRSITYGIMGFLFGLIGRGLYLGGLQRWTSIALGVIMVLSVIFPFLFRKVNLESRVDNALSAVKKLFGRFLSVRTYKSLFIIGLLNGLLPCGLVYIALAGAIVAGTAWDGALFMILFGLGTVPVMFALPVAGSMVSLKFRNRIRKIIPYFIILIGLIFILRGLNLGIPYLSPHIDHGMKAKCCQH